MTTPINNPTTEADLTSEAGVKALMESSTSETEWNANCDKVKKANGGYPGFWYALIVMSGVAAMTQSKW